MRRPTDRAIAQAFWEPHSLRFGDRVGAHAFFNSVVARARAIDATSPPSSAWQPIETAPQDGRTVIVGADMGEFGFVRGTAHFAGTPGSFISGWIARGFTDPPGELGLAHPTHWMPLPAPPPRSPTNEG